MLFMIDQDPKLGAELSLFFTLNICFSVLHRLLTGTRRPLFFDFFFDFLLSAPLTLLNPLAMLCAQPASPISHGSLQLSKWGTHQTNKHFTLLISISSNKKNFYELLSLKKASHQGQGLGRNKRLKQVETLSLGQIECSSCSNSSLSLALGLTSDPIKSQWPLQSHAVWEIKDNIISVFLNENLLEAVIFKISFLTLS